MSELVEICKEGLKKIKSGEKEKIIPWEDVELKCVIPYSVQADYLKREETRAKVDKSALKKAEEMGFSYVVVKWTSSEHTHGLGRQATTLLSGTFNFYIDRLSPDSK